MRELESEIEWVRAERQDAQQAAQREQKQAQARIKEAEDAASRAKAARRSASNQVDFSVGLAPTISSCLELT